MPTIVLAATDVVSIFNTLAGIFVKVGGAIVVIGWVITGMLYLTAAGNPETLSKAKKATIWCVVGTVVIVIAATAESFIRTSLGI